MEEVYRKTKINFCLLCLAKKLHFIEHYNNSQLLNKRNEFINGCRPQVKLLLKIRKDFNKVSLVAIYETEFLCF